MFYLFYYVMLMLVWGSVTLFIKPQLATCNPWIAECIEAVIKLAVWALPAVKLIKKREKDMEIPISRMFKNKIIWKDVWYYYVAMIVLPLISAYRTYGVLQINESFHIYQLITGFLVVGITEELAFRGFLWNGMSNKLSEAIGYLVNAVLFIGIHIPIWILQGKLVTNLTSGSWVTVGLLSLLFAYTFKQTKNLLVPISLHMLWDLMIFLLFG
ncbi:MAG: lysostaphin resistance A-like protein [Lachnospiraceae bacterium]